MSTRTYVAIYDPGQPGQVRRRYAHSDGYSSHYMGPTLREIRASAAAGDTHRLAGPSLPGTDTLTVHTTRIGHEVHRSRRRAGEHRARSGTGTTGGR